MPYVYILMYILASVGLYSFSFRLTVVPYESLILGQLLDLISPAKINLFDPRFESYDPLPTMILFKNIKG